MGRYYLTGRDGDRINAVLAAVGYNFSLLLTLVRGAFTCPLVDPLARPSWPSRFTYPDAAKFSSRPTIELRAFAGRRGDHLEGLVRD
jgi:hypothetical protein